jgi:hypothetical protein
MYFSQQARCIASPAFGFVDVDDQPSQVRWIRNCRPIPRQVLIDGCHDGSDAWRLSGARTGSLLKCCSDTLGNFFHSADTRNAQEFWRLSIAARRPVRVILYQWLRLTVIEIETPFHSFFLVILTLNQLLAGHIVFPVDLGSIELNMISAPGWQMDAAARQAIDNYFVSHANLHHIVQVYVGLS